MREEAIYVNESVALTAFDTLNLCSEKDVASKCPTTDLTGLPDYVRPRKKAKRQRIQETDRDSECWCFCFPVSPVN